MSTRNLLFAYGVLAFVAFLYSGYSMQEGFPGWYGNNEIIHYQYRANHIYLLFSALLMLLYAGSLPRRSNGLQITVALLLLVAHLFLFSAFMLEPAQASDQRPLTFYGAVLNIAAVALALLIFFGQHRHGE